MQNLLQSAVLRQTQAKYPSICTASPYAFWGYV